MTPEMKQAHKASVYTFFPFQGIVTLDYIYSLLSQGLTLMSAFLDVPKIMILFLTGWSFPASYFPVVRLENSFFQTEIYPCFIQKNNSYIVKLFKTVETLSAKLRSSDITESQ